MAETSAQPDMAELEPSSHSVSSTDDDDQFNATSLQAFQKELETLQAHRKVLDVSPTTTQQIGSFSIVCLVMNRTIGAGIFAQPVVILRHAGSSGVAIVLWIAAGLIVYSITVCWLELGMSVPTYLIEGERIAAPRSGGDKNYLEYIYRRPAMLATCVFGITFLIFGNLAGNSVQFGIYVEMARHPECGDDSCLDKASVLGWAIGVLTLCSFINIATRRYAIWLNNGFAIAKMVFVLFIVFAGFGWGSARGGGCREIDWATRGSGGSFGDIVLALVYAIYPYGGFEQPFYVLAEIKQPKKIFPKAANLALMLLVIFFPLANVSYLCMVPYTDDKLLPPNMAIAFFKRIDERIATRLVAIILAFFILGNIMAQTFTASRVKQEVAKEGILPWSLTFAKGSDTLLSHLSPRGSTGIERLRYHREQTPMAATILHWSAAVILVLLVGIPLKPSDAYGLLSFLKSFTIIVVLGLLTVGGLLYLKVDSWLSRPGNRGWLGVEGVRQWRPYLDPIPNIAAASGLAFLVVTVFVPPQATLPTLSQDSDGSKKLPYWVGPLAGWLAPLVGVIWWLALRLVQWNGRWEIKVTRRPFLEKDEDDEYVQKAETVEHEKVYESSLAE